MGMERAGRNVEGRRVGGGGTLGDFQAFLIKPLGVGIYHLEEEEGCAIYLYWRLKFLEKYMHVHVHVYILYLVGIGGGGHNIGGGREW